MKLSILIPTLPKRKEMFDRLVDSIESQITDENEVEILYCEYIDMSIGEKRNMLLNYARSKYVAFVDDDDRVSQNYIQLLMEGIEKDVDCCSLVGEYTVNGKNPKRFIHHLACHHYYETADAYYRYPNHLNCIRASIAKQFMFPEINHGEDSAWAAQIKKSKLLKTEHKINEVIYYYDFKTKK